jgi:hypothetical protein
MTKEELNQFEKLLTIISLGLSVAIKHQVINIDEAEQLLYSPLTMKKLNEMGVNPEMIDLIHAGTELEDLESLLPNELTKSLSKMEDKALKILTTSPKMNPQLDKWLSQYLKKDSSHLGEHQLTENKRITDFAPAAIGKATMAQY